jgi:hypothetical protein
MAATARKYHTQQLHYLRYDFAYNTSGIGSGVSIGKIPANALIKDTQVSVQTAFNAATTNTVSVGSAAAGTQVVNAQTVASVGSTTVAPASVGGLLSASADTELFVTYSQTGTAASAGVGSVVVSYTV